MSSPKEEKRPHKWNVKLFGFLFPFPSIYTISRKRIAFRSERCNWSDSQFICDNRLVNVESDCVLNCGIFNKYKHKSNGYNIESSRLKYKFYGDFSLKNIGHKFCNSVLLFYYSIRDFRLANFQLEFNGSVKVPSIIFPVLSPYFRFFFL